MTNAYHTDIITLLTRCGKAGLRVADITRYVYNLHSGLFETGLTYDMLHQTLRCYLWRQSTLRRSPIQRVRYGVYALKPDMAIQLDLDFEHQSSIPESAYVNPFHNAPITDTLFPDELDNSADFPIRTFPDAKGQLLLFPDLFP